MVWVMRQTSNDNTWYGRWGARASRVLLVGVSVGALSACNSLLEVDLPHLLTDAAIKDASTAETQINSAIALFECGYTAEGLESLGAEDVMESIAGVYSGGAVYDGTPDTGTCDSAGNNTAWFDQITGSRALLVTQPSRLVPDAQGTVTSEFPVGRGVYDRIQDEWDLGAKGDTLSVIASIYAAAALDYLGEFVCDIGIDGSDILSPTTVLDLAENWAGTGNGGAITGALGHLNAIGGGADFPMPFGIASSARNMATALRARIRWANRDFAGAAADAAAVLAADPTFDAWITREVGETRRNKIWYNMTLVAYSGMMGKNTWWDGSTFRPNPATGQAWPSPIPFTGYLFLGIMPDGRTLETSPLNTPVQYGEDGRDANGDMIPTNNTSVPDTRVRHFLKSIQGPNPRDVPDRYSGEDDDVPFITWEELKLIEADGDLAAGDAGSLADAIDLVNDIRSAKGLPEISGAYLTTLTDGNDDANEVRYMLLEERRREFYAEGGRWWSTKIQNTDLLWFPRYEGQLPGGGYNAQGVVRMEFATDEYESNPLWAARGGLDARGQGCANEFGSQAPEPS